MLVITQNGEQELRKEIAFRCDNKEFWRCIALRFPEAQRSERWLTQVADKIRAALGENNGRIFYCGENTIYVLAKYVTHKSYEFLLAHLKPLTAPAPIEGLASLFELPQDREKIEKSLSEKFTARAADIDLRETLRLDALHANLRETIDSRRIKRAQPSVLIIEDDPFSQRLVAKSVGEEYEVHIAGTAQEAMLSYIRCAPDFVFLDIGLPDVSGLELLLKLQEIDPRAHIVMLSGNGSQSNVVKAVENGAKGFVVKPFARDKLHIALQKCPHVQAKTKNARGAG